MVRYRGIHHLAFATNDIDTTIRFWRDLLRMRLVASMGQPGYRHYFFELTERDMIAFFEWPAVQPLVEKDHGAPTTGPFGCDHVSIGVESDEDLFELKARFEAADHWASEVVDHGFFHSLYSFDPNNIPIEFSAAVPEMDIRSIPQLKDRAPTAVAQEGPEPQIGHWPGAAAPPERRIGRIYPAAGSELFHVTRPK